MIDALRNRYFFPAQNTEYAPVSNTRDFIRSQNEYRPHEQYTVRSYSLSPDEYVFFLLKKVKELRVNNILWNAPFSTMIA